MHNKNNNSSLENSFEPSDSYSINSKTKSFSLNLNLSDKKRRKKTPFTVASLYRSSVCSTSLSSNKSFFIPSRRSNNSLEHLPSLARTTNEFLYDFDSESNDIKVLPSSDSVQNITFESFTQCFNECAAASSANQNLLNFHNSKSKISNNLVSYKMNVQNKKESQDSKLKIHRSLNDLNKLNSLKNFENQTINNTKNNSNLKCVNFEQIVPCCIKDNQNVETRENDVNRFKDFDNMSLYKQCSVSFYYH
jgi:hypothetical protein